MQGTKSEKEQKLVDLVQEPDFGTMFPCVQLATINARMAALLLAAV